MHDPSLYDTYQASTTPSRQPVKRSDLEAALSKADRFIRLTDQLLDAQDHAIDTHQYNEEEWLGGALGVAHRRAALDLSRALSKMVDRT